MLEQCPNTSLGLLSSLLLQNGLETVIRSPCDCQRVYTRKAVSACLYLLWALLASLQLVVGLTLEISIALEPHEGKMDFCVKSLPPCLWNYLHYYLQTYWKKCDWKRNSLCWIGKSEALRVLLVDLWRLDISVWVISVYRDTQWCSLAREMNDETQGLLTYIRPANGIIIADCSCKLCGWQHFSLNFEQCQQWDC